jgi:hypothetical protein
MQAHCGAQPPPHVEPSQYRLSGAHALLSVGGEAGQLPLLLLLPLLPELLPPWPVDVVGPSRRGGSMSSVLPPHAAATPTREKSRHARRILRMSNR